jgi:hypothetical protein
MIRRMKSSAAAIGIALALAGWPARVKPAVSSALVSPGERSNLARARLETVRELGAQLAEVWRAPR